LQKNIQEVSINHLLNEFKSFALKGNVIDMAVGVIIGGAFGKIVSSLVNDVIMPPIGLLLGGVNFNSLYIDLSQKGHESLDAAIKAGAPVLKYGSFLQTIVDFAIIAISIFMILKFLFSLKRKEVPPVTTAAPAAPIAIPEDIKLLTEIRDYLKKGNH